MNKKFNLLALPLAMVALTGCNSTQLEFMEKNQETAKWEATELAVDLAYTIQVEDEQLLFNVGIDGVLNTESTDGFLEISISDEYENKLVEDIQIYMQEGEAYFSRNYFEQLGGLTGTPLPEGLLDEDTEFILLRESDEMLQLIESMAQDLSTQEDLLTNYMDVASLLGIDIPVEKIDETYRIELDQHQIAELMTTVFTKGTQNIDTINNLFALGLTPDVIEEIKASTQGVEDELLESMNIIADQLSVDLVLDTTFGEDQLVQELFFNVTEEEWLDLSVSLEGTVIGEHTTVQEITIPGKVQEVELEDLMADTDRLYVEHFVTLELKSMTMYTETDEAIAIKGFEDEKGDFYIECKRVLNELGEQVIYNPTTGQVELQGEYNIPLNTIIKEGTSYITFDELAELGFIVEDYDTVVFVSALY